MPGFSDTAKQTGQKESEIEEGIIKGGYLFYRGKKKSKDFTVHLLGSGSIMNQVLLARDLLEKMGIPTNIWSITSYIELQREALSIEANNRRGVSVIAEPYIKQLFKNEKGIFVAATDYMASLPQGIAAWMPQGFEVLGTDGYGLSESRPTLRKHFEVDSYSIAKTALLGLGREEHLSAKQVANYLQKLESV